MITQTLKDFMATMEKQGHATASVAKQTLTALEKAERIISEDPKQLTASDLSETDLVKGVFTRFLTKFSSELSPGSANVYVNRVVKAAENYARYQSDPLGFKATFNKIELANGIDSKAKKKNDTRTRPLKKSLGENKDAFAEAQPELNIHSDKFKTVFPLRRNFMIPLDLPNDLKSDEVRRMAFYLLTLCEDFNPGTSSWPQGAPATTPALEN